MHTKPAQSNLKNIFFASAVLSFLTVSVFTLVFSVRNSGDVKTGLAAIPGDCGGPNGVPDGFVDLFDYGNLSRSFGLTQGQQGFDARCDFHVDQFNIIDLFDYQILANNFGRAQSTPTPLGTATPFPTTPPGSVDPNTMNRKFMFGYQGWFQCPSDGSPSPAWRHWFNGTPPNGTLFDYWPTTDEIATGDKCNTGLRLPNGQPAYLYSAYNQNVVLKHFQWMQQNGIDGVMLQRFGNEISPGSSIFAIRNKVTDNVRSGAEQTGRVWNIMYDITGTPGNVATTIINDWKYLVDTKHITQSSRYLKHNGKPVVVIWGFGFSDRPGSPADLRTVLNFFHNDPNPAYRAFVMGGVNNDWRTNGTWASTLTGFDAISPWMVGRIRDINGANNYRSTWVSELNYATQHNQLFMPVVFPGFSFHNQNSGQPLNYIPRLGGRFVWAQAYNALSAGATMLYGAMYDEVNEGTAFYKQATDSSQWPTGMQMVPLNTDGYTQIPSDWYLKVAGEITKMVKGQIPLSPNMSITPH